MKKGIEIPGFRQLDPLALIGLPTTGSITYIHVSQIIYCKGESSQASIHLNGNRRYLINRTLKECGILLEPFGFCRIHKSYLINLQYIKFLTRSETKFVDLADGSRIKVTNGYVEILRQRLHIL